MERREEERWETELDHTAEAEAGQIARSSQPSQRTTRARTHEKFHYSPNLPAFDSPAAGLRDAARLVPSQTRGTQQARTRVLVRARCGGMHV